MKGLLFLVVVFGLFWLGASLLAAAGHRAHERRRSNDEGESNEPPPGT